MGKVRTGRRGVGGRPARQSCERRAAGHNQIDPYLPDLLICRQEHAARVLDSVRAQVAEKAAG
jgi:hypothetical protein